MIAKLQLSSNLVGTWLKSRHVTRGMKVAAATLAILYMINGSEVAAEYAGSPQLVNADLGTRITQTIWTGVAWPIVRHNAMTADPLQRLGSLPEMDSEI